MNLEKKIKDWRKSLRSQAHLSDGFVEELEVHLRDAIEGGIDRGLDPEEAFDTAVKGLGDITAINQDERLALTNSGKSSLLLPDLLKNFFKVNGRQFRKNGLLNGINLAGLTVAFTATFFIGLFLHDELSFERHHPNAENTYRLSYEHTSETGVIEERAFSSGMWIDVIKDRVPAIDETMRFMQISYGYIENQATNQFFYEEGIYWSDPNFFDFLHFPLKYGNKEDQLTNPNSLVVTEDIAQKVFGMENPIGETLRFVRNGIVVNFVVTGVIFNPASNSHFQPNYVAQLEALQGIFGEQQRGWITKNPEPGWVYTYVKLRESGNQEQVATALQEFWNNAIPERAEFMEPLLTRLTDIHFQPPIKWEIDTPIAMSYVYGLIVIAAFILMIAMTNFVNLITAQASKRQKEIGLRKTLGSTRKQLRLQFFLESAGLVMLSMAVALGLTYLLLPQFNDLIEKRIDLAIVLSNPAIRTWFIILMISVAATAGAFPALYFTRKVTKSFNLNQFFKPEKVNARGRNSLVILQFAVAITLIISTVTVSNQLQLINNGKLGTNREAVVGIRTTRMGDTNQIQRFRNEIENFSQVASSTLGMHLPRLSDFGSINTRYFAPDINNEPLYWNKFDADGDFPKTFDLEFLAGRDFREDYDLNSLIINESAVKELNLSPGEAIGLVLKEDSINYVFGQSDGVVIGVISDFAYETVRKKIEPLVICANTRVNGALSVKLGPGNKQAAISQMGELWAEIYPGRPFEYWFLDYEFGRLYSQERRLGKLIPLFSGLAIIIALFGLFALTAYVSDLRKKEIGIRKVLGCSNSGILRLLSWQYLRTILIAVAIAIPLAWYGMDYWLENFTYRVNISLLVVGGSVLFVLLISLVTISLKSLKAANANPVDSLKYE
ncbi:MAG: FtsX-like permease family protein [Roseivirga sp.]|nr:FtsX-like permease family protein [Roseivirga sp.]